MAYFERRNGKLTGKIVIDAEWADPQQPHVSSRWHQAFAGMTKEVAEAHELYFRATGQKPPQFAASAPRDTFADVADRFKLKHPKWFAGRNGSINQQRWEFAKAHLGKLPVALV